MLYTLYIHQLSTSTLQHTVHSYLSFPVPLGSGGRGAVAQVHVVLLGPTLATRQSHIACIPMGTRTLQFTPAFSLIDLKGQGHEI